jgi:hypothetical protein
MEMKWRDSVVEKGSDEARGGKTSENIHYTTY